MAPRGKRYGRLAKHYVYSALNNTRVAFLAAKNGDQVNAIIYGLLTDDERIKIGRRIEIAKLLIAGEPYEQISETLQVGIQTVTSVAKRLNSNPDCYKLIMKRIDRVEKEFRNKAYEKVGGPKLFRKKTRYTGFKRKDVER